MKPTHDEHRHMPNRRAPMRAPGPRPEPAEPAKPWAVDEDDR